MRAHTPSALLADAQSFAERWSGRLADLDGASLAEALAELGDLRAARQEAEYYHYLAESTDSENAEIRDLGAWLEPRLTEIANVIRAFELEWIGLPADTAERLLGVARGRRRGACSEQAPPFRPVHAVGARGAAAQRARRDRAQGLADALQPASLDAHHRLRLRRAGRSRTRSPSSRRSSATRTGTCAGEPTRRCASSSCRSSPSWRSATTRSSPTGCCSTGSRAIRSRCCARTSRTSSRPARCWRCSTPSKPRIRSRSGGCA